MGEIITRLLNDKSRNLIGENNALIDSSPSEGGSNENSTLDFALPAYRHYLEGERPVFLIENRDTELFTKLNNRTSTLFD